MNHDYAVLQGVIVLIAAFVSIIGLIVDLLYGFLDPRITNE